MHDKAGHRKTFMALSVDVEDWFHSENVKAAVPGNWAECESRVEANTMRILQILANHGKPATFFVLGWVAQRFPRLVREIVDGGHEIASHGYRHELVYALSAEKFRQDVLRSKCLLEDLSGRTVKGYRAPCFSITPWAIDVLKECGFAYDSSMVPSLAHDRYGRISGIAASRPVFSLAEGFYEICVSCRPCGSRGIPWGGGGYFRLLPYPVWRQGIRAIVAGGLPYVFYIHPWDMDPGQPRVSSVKWGNSFRQQVGLTRCEQRFESLVAEFDWMTLAGLLESWREHANLGAANRAGMSRPGIAA
ncbi:MAG: XrtA system polysaccharide deacetylase [Hyphomicrobium sp.]